MARCWPLCQGYIEGNFKGAQNDTLGAERRDEKNSEPLRNDFLRLGFQGDRRRARSLIILLLDLTLQERRLSFSISFAKISCVFIIFLHY